MYFRIQITFCFAFSLDIATFCVAEAESEDGRLHQASAAAPQS